jgi:hypothetical protein
MPLYVTLSRGPSPDRAEPVLVLSDDRTARAVLRIISKLKDQPIPESTAPRTANEVRDAD